MRLGFLTAPFADTPLMDVADWAAANDFDSLEIACWPSAGGVKRRYAGTSHIDVANLSTGRATEIVNEIAGKGLAISGLGYYPNPLHPDPAHREQVIGHLRHVITAAEKMGIPLGSDMSVGGLHEVGHGRRLVDPVPSVGPTLGLVGVEQGLGGPAAGDESQFPHQIGHVPNTGAQTLTEQGRRLVGGITREEHVANPPPLRNAGAEGVDRATIRGEVLRCEKALAESGNPLGRDDLVRIVARPDGCRRASAAEPDEMPHEADGPDIVNKACLAESRASAAGGSSPCPH
jgi:hypothetical protein